MADIYTGNEAGAVDESLTLPKVKGENNNSRETRKNGTSDEDDFNRRVERTSDSGEMAIRSSEPKRNAKEIKNERKMRKLIEYPENEELQRIVIFLRSKNISEKLISQILKNGLCGGFDRLLLALGITKEELNKFSWQKRIDSSHPFSHSLKSKSSWMFSDKSMSPDNLYLKEHFGDILVQAMKEIVKRKPRDPVDFLGEFLINCKVSEEREIRRKEFEDELLALRKFTNDQEIDQQSEIIDYDEREESLMENDWNFVEYEKPQFP